MDSIQAFLLRKKTAQITGWLLIASLLIIPIFAYLSSHNFPDGLSMAEADNSQKDCPSRLVMEGIRYSFSEKGTTLLTAYAKLASIEKKKVGFFRINGIYQLELENFEADIYSSTPPAPSQDNNSEQAGPPQFSSGDVWDRIKAEADTIIPKTKRVAGFVARNVTLRYHCDEKNISTIRCAKLVFDSKGRKAVLQNSAMIRSGNRFLISKNMEVTDSGRVTVPGDYVLRTHDAVKTGRGLVTDLKLNL